MLRYSTFPLTLRFRSFRNVYLAVASKCNPNCLLPVKQNFFLHLKTSPVTVYVVTRFLKQNHR